MQEYRNNQGIQAVPRSLQHSSFNQKQSCLRFCTIVYCRDAGTDFSQARPIVDSKAFELSSLYFMDLENRGLNTVWMSGLFRRPCYSTYSSALAQNTSTAAAAAKQAIIVMPIAVALPWVEAAGDGKAQAARRRRPLVK